jgi:hypothetical protein
MLRSFVAVLVLAVAPVAARAADEENPYKNAKVGDYATYTITTKAAGQTIDGTLTQTVTAKTDKEATVKGVMVFNLGGKEMKFPEQEEKIDLTKPYDPTKGGGANLPGGAGEIKAEKDKDGKEKIKVNDKEYDTTWTSYKVKIKAGGQEIAGDMKAWMTKDMPGMVKMTMTADFMGQKIEMTTELKETGNKK